MSLRPQVRINATTTTAFHDGERFITAKKWGAPEPERVQAASIRITWAFVEGEWKVDGASEKYYRIKKDGTPYANTTMRTLWSEKEVAARYPDEYEKMRQELPHVELTYPADI